jgi:hypothetical protein
MAKQAYVYSGTDWVPLASEVTNLSGYYTKGEIDILDAPTGLKLLTPTSVAVGSGSGSVGTSGTVTFSAASSFSLNGVFSATYNNYVIDISNNVSGTGSIRLRASGTDNTSAVHIVRGTEIADSNFVAYRTNAGTSFFLQSVANNSIYIKNPYDNSNTYFANSGIAPTNASSGGTLNLMGAHVANYQADGFTITVTTGTMTGTVSVYGYKK